MKHQFCHKILYTTWKLVQIACRTTVLCNSTKAPLDVTHQSIFSVWFMEAILSFKTNKTIKVQSSGSSNGSAFCRTLVWTTEACRGRAYSSIERWSFRRTESWTLEPDGWFQVMSPFKPKRLLPVPSSSRFTGNSIDKTTWLGVPSWKSSEQNFSAKVSAAT